MQILPPGKLQERLRLQVPSTVRTPADGKDCKGGSSVKQDKAKPSKEGSDKSGKPSDESKKSKGDDKQPSNAKRGKENPNNSSNAAPANGKASDVSKNSKNEPGSQICKYWAQGECKNGFACMYLHSKEKIEKASAKAKASSSKAQTEPPVPKSKAGTKRDKKKVQCLGCGLKFKDWEAMCSKHFLCQGREPLCLCVECNKTFADDIDCAQHQSAKGHQGMARVNDEEEPTFVCGQCNKEFDSERAKEQHQDSTLHGDFPACSTCRRAFPNVQALSQHQQAKGHCGLYWVVEGESDSEDMFVDHTNFIPFTQEQLNLLFLQGRGFDLPM